MSFPSPLSSHPPSPLLPFSQLFFFLPFSLPSPLSSWIKRHLNAKYTNNELPCGSNGITRRVNGVWDRDREIGSKSVGERDIESSTVGLIRDPLHLSLKHFNNSLVLNYFGRLLLLNPLFICLPRARYTHSHTHSHTRSCCIHLAASDKCIRHPASSSRPGR